ncbi:hypothetical protein ACIKTA_17205 [Hansschlegelia beijingensis]|uniref:hypothetical protein n=1 Tax=Hansschlegelia beijingensis TaxID=1133344 RepID=UPI0037FD3807
MSKLPLAVEIADVVTAAEGPLDVQAAAAELHDAYPEAAVSREDIADALTTEREAAGLPVKPSDTK